MFDALLVWCYEQHKDVFLIFIVFIWAIPPFDFYLR